MKFWFGTGNKYKVRELASILSPLGIGLESLPDLNPPETEDTFKGNAIEKVKEYGIYVRNKLINRGVCEKQLLHDSDNFIISEDSGISVFKFNNLPGPWSARFSDFQEVNLENGSLSLYSESNRTREEIDKANNQRVLDLLGSTPTVHRAAKMTVCLVVADLYGSVIFSDERSTHGWIATEPKGEHGFGYDPIFISDSSFGKTWAEIDPMRKNLISHRRVVLSHFTHWLSVQLKKENL